MMENMKLLTLKRQVRRVVIDIESDVRFSLESWLKENIVSSLSEMTEINDIADAMENQQIPREDVLNFINFYGFWNLGEPLFVGEKIFWRAVLKNQEKVIKDDAVNAESFENEESFDESQEDVAKDTGMPVETVEDAEPTETVEDVVIADTISQSKRNRGKWMGLRRWLTVNNFNKSAEQSMTLKEIMAYYHADKGETSNITYEFLRDRLLFDGFIEQNTNAPIEQRVFGVTEPKISLKKKLNKG